jgi:uncharacterized protein YerC
MSARWRLKERRKHHLAGSTPSLSTALRQVRMRIVSLQDRRAVEVFVSRLMGVAHLAEVTGRGRVARALEQVAAQLAAQHTQTRDVRPALTKVLCKIEALAA